MLIIYLILTIDGVQLFLNVLLLVFHLPSTSPARGGRFVNFIFDTTARKKSKGSLGENSSRPCRPLSRLARNLNYAGQLPMFLVGHFYSDTIRYTILFLLLIHIWFQANSILWYLLVEFLWNICLDLRLIIFSKDRRVASPPSLQDVQSVFSVISLIDVYRKMIERLFQIVLIWSVGESWLSFNN